MPIGSRRDSRNSRLRYGGRSGCWKISLTASHSISATRSTKRNRRPPTSVKMSSEHYSEIKMRHLVKVSFTILLIASLAGLGAAAKKEYLTEDELDMIRDAQELGARVQT